MAFGAHTDLEIGPIPMLTDFPSLPLFQFFPYKGVLFLHPYSRNSAKVLGNQEHNPLLFGAYIPVGRKDKNNK